MEPILAPGDLPRLPHPGDPAPVTDVARLPHPGAPAAPDADMAAGLLPSALAEALLRLPHPGVVAPDELPLRLLRPATTRTHDPRQPPSSCPATPARACTSCCLRSALKAVSNPNSTASCTSCRMRSGMQP